MAYHVNVQPLPLALLLLSRPWDADMGKNQHRSELNALLRVSLGNSCSFWHYPVMSNLLAEFPVVPRYCTKPSTSALWYLPVRLEEKKIKQSNALKMDRRVCICICIYIHVHPNRYAANTFPNQSASKHTFIHTCMPAYIDI